MLIKDAKPIKFGKQISIWDRKIMKRTVRNGFK